MKITNGDTAPIFLSPHESGGVTLRQGCSKIRLPPEVARIVIDVVHDHLEGVEILADEVTA